MSIIRAEDSKYVDNISSVANIKAPSVSINSNSNSIIRPEDSKYLNSTSTSSIIKPEDQIYIGKNVSTPTPKLNIQFPDGNLNLNTSSSLLTKTLPSNLLEKSLTPESIRSTTPQESKSLKENPITFQDAINNYSQNTRNKMTTGQKVKEDINTIGLEASNNLIRPVVGSIVGAPEKLIRTGVYGTMLATGVINKKQYDQIIADEESGQTNTIAGLIANDPKVGAAIKLGEQDAYRKIAGAGAETGLNFVAPELLKGGGFIRNTLEGTALGGGYGVAMEAQNNNPDYLQGFRNGAIGGGILSGSISVIGKTLGSIANKVESERFYNTLANTSNKEEIFNNLQSKFPEVNNTVLQGMADDLVKVNSKQEIKDYFKAIDNLKNTTPTNFNENGFTPQKQEIYHGTNTGILNQDAGGNINFGTNIDEISQFGGKSVKIPLDKFNVKDFSTKDVIKNDSLSKGKSVQEKSNILEPQTKLPKLSKNTSNVSYTETIPPKIKQSKSVINPKVDKLIEVKPNIEDNTFKSRVYERLQKENPELLQGDLTSTKINFENESEKAVKLLKEDKQKLYDIAMGKESSPDLTSTIANITLAEKAIEEGNNELASKLIKNRSLAQTRRGQEIVSEKASLTDNSSSRYVKQLLSDRLDEVGKKYTDNIKDITQKSSKQKAIAKIEKDVTDLENRIKNKKIKTSEALALLDKLTCLA